MASVGLGLRVGLRLVGQTAAADDLAGVTGAYFERLERAEPQAQAHDPEARRRLMALIERLTAEG